MIGNVLSNAKVFLKERTPWKKAACAKGKWHNILPTQELEYIRIGSYFTKKKPKHILFDLQLLDTQPTKHFGQVSFYAKHSDINTPLMSCGFVH